MRVLISLRSLLRRQQRLVFVCWLVLRASWIWSSAISMPSRHSSSLIWILDGFMHLLQGCGEMSGKIVRLNRSLYGLRQASRSWHDHLMMHMKSLGFEQCPADACDMRLIESRSVSIVTVVHVDGIFAVGFKDRCHQFCDDLNPLVPINNLGELRWYSLCRFSRDWEAGRLAISQQSFAENTA